MTRVDEFISASPYRHPVDHKKLRFVYEAVERLCRRRGCDPAELSYFEVACGVGGITLPLATLGGPILAIDIDQPDLDALATGALERGKDNLTVLNANALDYRAGRQFDVVVASEVFEHIVDPERLVEAVAEHMAPGSILVVTTPNGYGPWETINSLKLIPRRWNWLRRLVGKPPRGESDGREHEQRYTKDRLTAMFAAHGLELAAFAKSDFVLTTVRALRASRFFGTLDTRLADIVPHWAASGWYFEFIMKDR